MLPLQLVVAVLGLLLSVTLTANIWKPREAVVGSPKLQAAAPSWGKPQNPSDLPYKIFVVEIRRFQLKPSDLPMKNRKPRDVLYKIFVVEIR